MKEVRITHEDAMKMLENIMNQNQDVLQRLKDK